MSDNFFQVIHKFVKFLGVGVITTGIQYALLVLFVEFKFFDALLASALSYFLSAVISYLLNYQFTFKSKASHKSASLKFGLIVIVGLGLNVVIFALFNKALGIHYLISQLLATLLVLLWNFTASMKWSFKS